MTLELRESFREITGDMDPDKKAGLLLDFSREMARMSASMLNCDKQIQAKRKMLLDIEKENVMTIAAALRSIPKKEKDEEEDDPMTALLKKRQRVQ